MSKLFWAMLSFITRLPVPRRWSQGLDFEHYSRGIITFPLIGLLLGAISGLVFMVLQAWCGVPLAALFSVLVLALMTGDSIWTASLIPVMAYFLHVAAIACWKSCVIAVRHPRRSGIDFCGTGKDSGVKRVGSAWRTDPCIAGGSMCGQPRDCRIIDVSSSLCAGRRAWQCVHWQN